VKDLLERLQLGDVIIGDGALGALLMQRGWKHDGPPELLNLTNPRIIEEIASLYLEAGAEIVTTNSFGASPLRLRQFSLEKETEAINRAAVDAVRRAVGDKAYISASVGPSACMIKPLGTTEPEAVYAAFQRQIGALLSGGIDMICIETMIDLTEATLAISAARSLDQKIPIMATLTFAKRPRGYFTLMGTSVRDAASGLQNAGANIVGSNCGNGMEQMVEIAREFRQCAAAPIAIQGNAGMPIVSAAGIVYPETPDFVAGKAVELRELGVQIIGGCCGTGPDHIRAIRNAIDAHR
jgi:5-methyltetrahydrofolate--homocysteine methyltransferase